MRLSSYNAKCLIVYALYCAYKFTLSDYFETHDFDRIEITANFLLIPIISYIGFPFILILLRDCKIDKWGIVKMVDDTLNFIYLTIKEPTVKHNVSWADTLKNNYFEVWFLLKIIFYVGLLIGMVAFYIVIIDMY